MTEPIVYYKFDKEKVRLIKRVNNGLLGIDEFDLLTRSFQSGSFKDVQCKWINFNDTNVTIVEDKNTH